MTDPSIVFGSPGAAPPASSEAQAGPGAANIWSHPDAPVRHSYPVAVRGVGLGVALRLLMRTLPYAFIRFGLLLGFSIATILWFAITFGGGAWLGVTLVPVLGWVWVICGICLYGYIWHTILRYLLHLVECGHIAVLTELILRDRIGNGSKSMFAYGIETVKARFAEVNVLFGLNMLVRGVVGAFNRTLDFIGELLPIPGLESILQIVHLVLRAATRYIDKTIFSYNLARGDENPWRSAQDGILYYCQNAKEILKTSLWIVVLDKILVVLVWLVLLAPSAAVAYMLPPSVRSFGTIVYLLIAALFASNIRGAFLKPLFLVMVLVKYHTMIQGQPINETWDVRLSELSGKFGKLKEQARTWTAGPRAPAAGI